MKHIDCVDLPITQQDIHHARGYSCRAVACTCPVSQAFRRIYGLEYGHVLTNARCIVISPSRDVSEEITSPDDSLATFVRTFDGTIAGMVAPCTIKIQRPRTVCEKEVTSCPSL